MDNLTPERRSWLMSQIKGKNSRTEIAVRKLIFSLGFRYRVHVATLPGKPDIVFPGRRKIIFVHGCFWHGHLECRYARLPKERTDFWAKKMDRNRERDSRNVSDLQKEGWVILVIWQCELKKPDRLTDKILAFLAD